MFLCSLTCTVSSVFPSSCPFIPPPVYVSKPRLSFSISKEGGSYCGNVTCWTTRGSPPVNFSLLLDDKEVGSVTATESLAAWFPVAMVPGLDMGVARCRVNSEVQELMSEPVTLVVGMSYTCEGNVSFCDCLALVPLWWSSSHSAPLCSSSPSERWCGSGGWISLQSWLQNGCSSAELSDRQRNFPSRLLALERLSPSLWDICGLPHSARPVSLCPDRP